MSTTMDEESRQLLAELEKALGPNSGIGKIDRGECPFKHASPAACLPCIYGHLLDCHYPKTCMEAECSHYKETTNAENQD